MLHWGVRGPITALTPTPWLWQRGGPGSDGSLSLGPSPCGCRVPSLLGHRCCLLCGGAIEGAYDTASGTVVFVTSQSPHRFHFLTWHSQWFLQTVCKLLFIPRCQEPALCSGSIWVELFLKTNSLSLPVPAAAAAGPTGAGASSMNSLAAHSACKCGLSWELFFAGSTPQSRSTRCSEKITTAFLLLPVGVWVLTLAINGNSVQQPHGL